MRDLIYGDFIIRRNLPEARQYKYCYEHKDFDGTEDTRHGHCKTIEECIEAIDEYWGKPELITEKEK